MSLYPTPSRLALLRAVSYGEVLEGITDEHAGVTWLTTGAEDGEPARKVTARIDEMHRAGWVELADDAVTWRLTELGRIVLDGKPAVVDNLRRQYCGGES